MKAHLLIFLCVCLSWHAAAQYVPKDKRKQPTDTIKPTPKDTLKKPTSPTSPTKPEREPLEHKFIGYAMALPTFIPNTFRPNGASGSFNLGYRLTERLNLGIVTSFGYQNYNNVQLSNGAIIDASIRNMGVGLFGHFDLNQNYFLWAEYANYYTKIQYRNPATTQQSQYAQPLAGFGTKTGDERGFAMVVLFNPKYGDPYSPYPSLIVTKFFYYFHF